MVAYSFISFRCNPAGEKHTWQQLKMKYKNIVQTANRKKADAHKMGGGPAPPPLTEAEELALSQNIGRPVAEGIPGGSSSSDSTPQDTNSDGAICLVEPPHPQQTLAWLGSSRRVPQLPLHRLTQ
ncbi:hypothetical protein N1851_019837 [Merluccius polli]|uniref:Uncharacterized protein n=1 Tax=Merluccius polli TaxID=89951 RepID=A0AA47ML65_MERPO|nr:hypothetical protein N1851_019837 [Merluccius polli]